LPRDTDAADAGESSTRGAPMTSIHFRANFNGSSFTQVIKETEVEAVAAAAMSLLSQAAGE